MCLYVEGEADKGVGACQSTHVEVRSQRTVHRNWFSLSTVWLPEILAGHRAWWQLMTSFWPLRTQILNVCLNDTSPRKYSINAFLCHYYLNYYVFCFLFFVLYGFLQLFLYFTFSPHILRENGKVDVIITTWKS